VIGTGHMGIAIWAAMAVRTAPPRIRATSVAKLRGITRSIRFVLVSCSDIVLPSS